MTFEWHFPHWVLGIGDTPKIPNEKSPIKRIRDFSNSKDFYSNLRHLYYPDLYFTLQ